jgi:rhodanese-related sulfurtransferase
MTYQNITQDELKACYGQPPGSLPFDVLLDVRTDAEFEVLGHLPGAVLLPIQELERRLGELNPSAKTLVMCQHGVRSVNAAWFLVQQGFMHITNLTEGLAYWNGPLEHHGQVTSGHPMPDSLFVTDFV